MQFLDDARRPLDPERFDAGGVPEAEVGLEGAGAARAVARGNFPQLPPRRAADGRQHFHPGPDAGAVGDIALKPDDDPAVAVAIVPVQEVFPADVRDKEIEKPVMVDVHPGAAEGIGAVTGRAARFDGGEGAVAVVVIKRVAKPAVVGHKNVDPTVVVVISPGRTGRISAFGALVDDFTCGDAGEGTIALVMIERAVDPAGVYDEQIQVPVVVVVHPGTRQRVATGSGNSVRQSAERAVAVVGIKHRPTGTEAPQGLVGHQQVRSAVVVEVAPGQRGRDLKVVRGDRTRSNPRKGAVAVVPVKEVGVQIDADAQVEESIPIKISPGR